MTTIVVMVPMKVNAATKCTKHVQHKSLLVKISSVFGISTDVMVRMIVVTDRMRLAVVKKKTVHVQLVNLPVLMDNVLIIIWYVTKSPIALMILMNHCIVMLMNVPK